MADDQKTTKSSPAQPGQKSPLDVLEDILGDAKGAAKAGKAKEEAEKKLAQEAKAQEELAAQQAQQTAIDSQKLQDQISKLKEIEHTPEYKARVEQQEEKQQEEQEDKEEVEGYQVRQLGHTKI